MGRETQLADVLIRVTPQRGLTRAHVERLEDFGRDLTGMIRGDAD